MRAISSDWASHPHRSTLTAASDLCRMGSGGRKPRLGLLLRFIIGRLRLSSDATIEKSWGFGERRANTDDRRLLNFLLFAVFHLVI